jgi:hypothetical protein
MNKFLLLITVCAIGHHGLQAQDTIYKRNGDVVFAKVMEINPVEVKYKKFNFSDGPLYIDRKETIRLIKFANGMKEEFELNAATISSLPVQQETYYREDRRGYTAVPREFNKIYPLGSKFTYQNNVIGENDLHRMLLKTRDKEIITLVGKSKDSHILQFIGFGAIPLGIGAIYFLQKSGFGSYSYYGRSSPNNGDLALSAVCLVGAIACPIGSGIFKQKRKNYNSDAIDVYNVKY